MKPTRLTKEEISVVTNPEAGDLILLEIIKGMDIYELRSFDVYTPLYRKHYDEIQMGLE